MAIKSVPFILGLILASPAAAEPILLDDYLSSVDRTAVQFSGRIHYGRYDGGLHQELHDNGKWHHRNQRVTNIHQH